MGLGPANTGRCSREARGGLDEDVGTLWTGKLRELLKFRFQIGKPTLANGVTRQMAKQRIAESSVRQQGGKLLSEIVL